MLQILKAIDDLKNKKSVRLPTILQMLTTPRYYVKVTFTPLNDAEKCARYGYMDYCDRCYN